VSSTQPVEQVTAGRDEPADGVEPTSTPGPGGPAWLRDPRLPTRLFVASVLLACSPVVVAVVRAIHRRWIPTSDDALFAIRARDVFSYHHVPLLGLDSSASLAASTTLHHPGPLLFDVLAVPVRLFGGHAGLALGVGLINVVVIVITAVFAARRGGPLVGTAAMALAAGLCWAMGSEALFEPWQPFSLLLPFLCFLVLAWSVSCGDLVALPVAAVVGSFVLQTHLSYVLLVPTLAIWALVGLALILRRARRDDAAGWPRRRERAQQAVLLSLAVGAVCWIQPLLDQITGQGNLGELLGNASPPKRTIGYGYGTRLMASVVALPPFWFRPSMNRTLLPIYGWTAPSRLSAATALTGLAVVLGGSWWLARRRHDLTSGRALTTVVVGLAAGFATAGRIPITAFGLEAHVFWWLWPLSVFIFFVVVIILVRSVASRLPALLPVGALAVVAAVFAGLAVPTLAQGLSPNIREDAIPTTRAVDAQLGQLQGKGPILVDPLLKSRLADPYGLALIAELQRRGISFVAKDPQLVGQLGSARRDTGTKARSELFLQVGGDPRPAPAGTPRIVDHQGLPGPELRERAQLIGEITDYIRAGRLRLNPRGRQALTQHGGVPSLLDPTALFAYGRLSDLVHHGYLDLDPGWKRRFERYAQLEDRWDVNTVQLYLETLPTRAGAVDLVR